MLNEEIIRLTETLTPWMIELRRTIHQNPELCNQEFATQALVIRELGAMGITEIKKYFNTGLAAVIRGSAPGKTIAIRADMDALSITEETQLPFSSANSGIMHACGHDGHTAILLGTARVLSQLKGNFKGNVKLIFQPAEENGPQGGGALPMIKEGVLTDEPAVDSIIGLHILPDFPVGTIAGEDFSYFAEKVPAMYMWLGGKIEDGKERILHSSVYNFSEQAMGVGVKAMSKIAIDFLNSDLLMQSIYRG